MTGRLHRIDEIRGITLISMILYHFCWDLKFLAGFKMEWYVSPIGTVWQKSICITFILISGFCFSMGHKRFKRSLLIFVCGLIITAVTLIFMPSNRIIFGILTFIGTAGLLTIPVNRLIVRGREVFDRDNFEKDTQEKGLQKSDDVTKYICLLIVSFILFIIFYTVNKRYLNFVFNKVPVPDFLCHGYINTFIGFTDATFFSTDYFSLLPWYFMYLCGYFLYLIYKCQGEKAAKITEHVQKSSCRPLAFFGRHSLIIYMLHQPVAAVIVAVIIYLR